MVKTWNFLPTDGARHQSWTARDLRDHLFFVHVPKTGGTSVEQATRPDLTAFELYRSCCPPGSFVPNKNTGTLRNATCCMAGT